MVFHDLEHGIWGSRISGDAGAIQRRRIRTRNKWRSAAPKTPDATDENRVVGRRFVQFLTSGPTLLREDAGHVEVERWIPDRHRHNPFARLGFVGKLSDPRLNVPDGADGSERREYGLQPFSIQVRVTVNEAGDHRFAVQIQNPGSGTTVQFHVSICANSDDPIAGNGERSRDGEFRIDGEDLAVA